MKIIYATNGDEINTKEEAYEVYQKAKEIKIENVNRQEARF